MVRSPTSKRELPRHVHPGDASADRGAYGSADSSADSSADASAHGSADVSAWGSAYGSADRGADGSADSDTDADSDTGACFRVGNGLRTRSDRCDPPGHGKYGIRHGGQPIGMKKLMHDVHSPQTCKGRFKIQPGF